MIHLSLCDDSSEHEGAELSLSSSESATRTIIIPRDTIATDYLFIYFFF